MKLIESKAELVLQPEGLEGVYKQIEFCGRTCYKSTDKITDESAKPFVERMIASKHTAMLEQGTIYLKSQSGIEDTNFWILANSPYAKVVDDDISNMTYITTNLRAIIELFPTTWHGFLRTYMCEPTEQHEKRYTIKFTTDRGISHELVRHRVFSFAQESTRYCNYSKDKFGGEISYIMPSWFPKANMQQQEAFMQIMKATEDYYMALLGQWDERKPDARFRTGFKDNPLTPQQARQVLPNALKTEVCMTGFASDWRFLIDLRLFEKTGKAHPDMLDLMQKAQKAMQEAGIWEGIMKYPSKFD